MSERIEFTSVDEAKEYAQQQPGKYYVLSAEVLDQIESAEASGGFEGGMSGASGEGGFSAPGVSGPDSSTSEDTNSSSLPEDFYYWRAGAVLDGAIEIFLGIRDLAEGIRGDPVGPVLLVPKRELDRWLKGGSDDEA